MDDGATSRRADKFDRNLDELVKAANQLRDVFSEGSNAIVPDEFDRKAILELCGVAEDVKESPPTRQPALLRVLHQELAVLGATIPHDEDADGEFIYEHLVTRYSLYHAKAGSLAEIIRGAVPIHDEDEPRVNPDSQNARDLYTLGNQAVNSALKGEEELDRVKISELDPESGRGPATRQRILAYLREARASGRLAKAGAILSGVRESTFRLLADSTRNLRGSIEVSLRGLGYSLDVASRAAHIVDIAGMLQQLSNLCNEVADEIKDSTEKEKDQSDDSVDEDDSDIEPSLNDLLLELEGHLREDKTTEAQVIASQIVKEASDGGTRVDWSIDLNRSDVVDISPLEHLPYLHELKLAGTRTKDLTALTNLATLQSITLSDSSVTDISPLERLTALRSLDLSFTRVNDIKAISGLTALKVLRLERSGVRDISALANLSALRTLTLKGTNVTDLSSLRNLTALRTLILKGNNVTDVSALAELTALQVLDLDETNVTDISALERLTSLVSLYLYGTEVTDVSPLAKLTSMETLKLNGTGVTDVSALEGMKALRVLKLNGTKVSDASPLANLLALEDIALEGTRIKDVRPILALPNLKSLYLPGGMKANIESLRQKYGIVVKNER